MTNLSGFGDNINFVQLSG